ncbi:MAG: acetyl-CoA carboxylase biotin carboxyl carrier protein subunit [Lachnospiraceae bacterium]|nr:acetyl-CoA carboxylase biotin carboxyl carrier protein subunit [Lachnospiraceae bacterium]
MKKYRIKVDGRVFEVEVEDIGRTTSSVFHVTPGTADSAAYVPAPAAAPVSGEAEPVKEEKKAAPVSAGNAAAGDGETVTAELAGKVWKIVTSVGQQVKKGDQLIILEAMKMEIPVKATKDGIIDRFLVTEGSPVEAGQALVSLK